MTGSRILNQNTSSLIKLAFVPATRQVLLASFSGQQSGVFIVPLPRLTAFSAAKLSHGTLP
jgi:hypothetical protein